MVTIRGTICLLQGPVLRIYNTSAVQTISAVQGTILEIKMQLGKSGILLRLRVYFDQKPERKG